MIFQKIFIKKVSVIAVQVFLLQGAAAAAEKSSLSPALRLQNSQLPALITEISQESKVKSIAEDAQEFLDKFFKKNPDFNAAIVAHPRPEAFAQRIASHEQENPSIGSKPIKIIEPVAFDASGDTPGADFQEKIYNLAEGLSDDTLYFLPLLFENDQLIEDGIGFNGIGNMLRHLIQHSSANISFIVITDRQHIFEGLKSLTDNQFIWEIVNRHTYDYMDKLQKTFVSSKKKQSEAGTSETNLTHMYLRTTNGKSFYEVIDFESAPLDGWAESEVPLLGEDGQQYTITVKEYVERVLARKDVFPDDQRALAEEIAALSNEQLWEEWVNVRGEGTLAGFNSFPEMLDFFAYQPANFAHYILYGNLMEQVNPQEIAYKKLKHIYLEMTRRWANITALDTPRQEAAFAGHRLASDQLATEIGRRTFSDFSDTIAKPKPGSAVDNKGSFRPFEERLREIVAEDVPEGMEREAFLQRAEAAFESFKAIRRDKNSPLSLTGKMKIWLTPFAGKLRQAHIDKLVEEFELNDNFFRAIDIMQEVLGTDTVRTVSFESGTLTEIIKAFLEKPEVRAELEKRNLSYSIDAQGLGLSESDGVFNTSRMPEVISKLIIDGDVAYPEVCFVLGDTPMEGYKPGFGSNLLNVQRFDEQAIRERISFIYTGLLAELNMKAAAITEKSLSGFRLIEQAI